MTGLNNESIGISPKGGSSGLFRSADTYPLPVPTFISIWKFVFSSRLQITKFGLRISISVTGVISDALISPGPLASKINFFVPSDELLRASDFTFKTISVTSSLTPFIEVNSCNTPSICIDVTAAPLIDDNKTLLREFPNVSP